MLFLTTTLHPPNPSTRMPPKHILLQSYAPCILSRLLCPLASGPEVGPPESKSSRPAPPSMGVGELVGLAVEGTLLSPPSSSQAVVVGIQAVGVAWQELCLSLRAGGEVLAVVEIPLPHALRHGRLGFVQRLPRHTQGECRAHHEH